MILIDESIFDKIISEVTFENVSESMLTNPSFSDDLKKYLSLVQYPFKFKDDVESLNLYYNKYYFFLKFLVKYKVMNGYDAGIEQQEFKLLEEGEIYPDIDWEVIKSISNKLKDKNRS